MYASHLPQQCYRGEIVAWTCNSGGKVKIYVENLVGELLEQRPPSGGVEGQHQGTEELLKISKGEYWSQ
jgi:hypothetical protein